VYLFILNIGLESIQYFIPTTLFYKLWRFLYISTGS